MGAWGTNSFENDTASDWVYELAEGGSPKTLAEAFDVERAKVLDGADGEVVIAASEVVLALAGDFSEGLPTEVRDWGATHSELSAGVFRSECIEALDRVLGPDSELLELWSEAGDAACRAWRSNVEELRRRVEQIAETPDGSAPGR